MPPEPRLDHLERIAKLLAKPCPRVRRRKMPKLSTEEYVRAGGFIGLYGARLARPAKSEEYTDHIFDALIEELREVPDGDEEMLKEFDGDFDEL